MAKVYILVEEVDQTEVDEKAMQHYMDSNIETIAVDDYGRIISTYTNKNMEE